MPIRTAIWFGDYYGWGKLKSETNVTCIVALSESDTCTGKCQEEKSVSIAPPVKMDGNTIVDGNHRMVAGLLCNQIPASTPGTALLSKPRIPLKDIQPDPIDWW